MICRYLIGDVFDVLATLEDGSVDLVLTSPPFLALRSYLPADHPDKGKEIGSEPTPAAFIDTMLDLTEEWARVLAPHGSICVELGDTYSGSGGAGGDYNADGLRDGQAKFDGSAHRSRTDAGWPEAKSLCLIPELYRIALVYGFNPLTGRATPRWRARNVIRWCRPNPPVGALGDKVRPATSDMVVACKSARRWFDLDAVRGPNSPTAHKRGPKDGPSLSTRQTTGARGDDGQRDYHDGENAGAPPLDHWWHDEDDQWCYSQAQQDAAAQRRGWEQHANDVLGVSRLDEGDEAFPQDAWLIPTEPYKGSHYATWPSNLLVKPVEAMCPRRVCRTCGKPSERIVGFSDEYKAHRLRSSEANTDLRARRNVEGHRVTGQGSERMDAEHVTLGWSDCGHDDWRPGVVVDPFAGSGTTLAVATGHGRDAIGIDLDERNADLARERVGMFLEVPT